MKKLLLGNDAVARGLYEAGCVYVSSYPGTPSTEITECAAEYNEVYAEWAPNEKVAVESALGASIAGARSLSAMKHVGLNVAADPLFTSTYTGVNGGFVIVVADDPSMHSSQNEQDSRHYAIAAKLPMLEPSDSPECKDYTKLAFELSERFDTPVLLKVCTRVAHSQGLTELCERVELPLKEYIKSDAKYVMKPANSIKKHPIVEKHIADLKEYAYSIPLNTIEYNSLDIGIITAGVSYQYAKEVFPNASYLKLGMVNPLSDRLLTEFAANVKRVIVIEELDGIIEQYCKSLGIRCDGKNLLPNIGEYSQELLRKCLLDTELPKESYPTAVPVRPPVMCPGCPHRGTFYVLKKLKLTVFGDIGCYTLGSAPPLNAVDTTICMGASISALHGFNTVRRDSFNKCVAVIGDSTFMHSGITGLVDIIYNKSLSTVLVLDNSITGMTGHQQNPCTGLTLKNEPTYQIKIEDIARAAGVERVVTVDPNNIAECERVIAEEVAAAEPSVVIIKRPCALLKYVKKDSYCTVDENKCRSCRNCMSIGCPAISISNKKAVIDTSLCIGCKLCEQLCKFDAISETKRG